MSRKAFKVGDKLTVKCGSKTTAVAVEFVTGRSIFVRGPVVCGMLKYYKNIDNYTVSVGMSNGKVLDRYELVA